MPLLKAHNVTVTSLLRRCKNVSFLLLLLIPMFIGLRVSPAGAVQQFTDEAGRLIYSIDDDGIVSMFESSPGIDITLSVTRGTREQMQPQATEVLPSSVPAGTSNVLKIKGKNLIGASVKMNRRGIEMGPYSGKPTSLDIPIRVAPDVPPGEVPFEVVTPIGSTKAGFRVTQMQIGSSSSGSSPAVRREGEKRQTIPTTAPASCPDGMVGVAAESGGFCIEIEPSFTGDIRKAEKTCAMAGKRLCLAHEWQHACEQASQNGLALKDIIGDWEWTGSYAKRDAQVQTPDTSDDLKSVLVGKSDCQTQNLYPSWRTEPFPGRCCK